jgi:hypothetical protein
MELHTREDRAIFECYTKLYAESTPSAKFEELVDNAKINDRGEKIIPYNDYEIEKNKYIAIVDECAKKWFKSYSYKQDAFKRTIDLGCSPRIKKH